MRTRRPETFSRRSKSLLACSLALSALASGPLDASGSPTDAAGELLRGAIAAYRQVPAMRDTLQVTETRGDKVTHYDIEYVLGAGSDAELSAGGLRAVSLDGRLFVVYDDVPGKYLEAPLAGTLHETLVRVLGDAAPPPIATISMRQAANETEALDNMLAQLGMNLLGPLAVVRSEAVSSDRGRDVQRVHLEATEGRVELDLRPNTFFVTSMRILKPASESSEAFSLEIDFEPGFLERAPDLVQFDPQKRKRVDSPNKLVQTRMAAGERFPNLPLTRLVGGLLALSELQGQVTVLDFFSSRCQSCPDRLAETERLASWADAEGLEVVFLAVNTLERVSNDRQAHAVATEFRDTHQISLPIVLDWNHELLITLGAPAVPTLYIVAPDGYISAFYDGVSRPSIETLQQELIKLVGAPPAE